MIFISLAKFRGKPTKDSVAQATKLFERMTKEGAKILGVYYTLGRYDAITIVEGPDEKAAMRGLLRWGDFMSTETLVAVPVEEARKLVE
jgi:uncharacterized protein with GYD domain